jgi:hypothetical protein
MIAVKAIICLVSNDCNLSLCSSLSVVLSFSMEDIFVQSYCVIFFL